MTCLARLALVLGLLLAALDTVAAVETVPGMPPVIDPANLYSETTADKLSPTAAKALPPNRRGSHSTHPIGSGSVPG